MVKKWNIYYADLDPIKGSEQRGVRPVLVISKDSVNENLPICTVIPFSSYKNEKKIYASEVFFEKSETRLSKDSILMIHQIRTISVERINSDSIGSIDSDELKSKVNFALIEYFQLY